MNIKDNKFPIGIIEGYFGEYWSMKDRLSYPKWLKRNSYNFFIYAPKNDKALRLNWDKPFTKEWLSEIQGFAKECKDNDIAFGVGFTPKGATLDLETNLPKIHTKILEIINNLEIQNLAILFDDLKIDNEHEGQKQNKILREVFDILEKHFKETNKKIGLITCPSFYTTDPILEKVFGKMPENYFKDFLEGLSHSIDIFWTGEKVISETYTTQNLTLALKNLGRKPFIWDNYPVNDGKSASDKLFLNPFKDRSVILDYSSGIAINPMKEPNLSKIPLVTLPNALTNKKEEKLNDEILTQALFCDKKTLKLKTLSKNKDKDKVKNTNKARDNDTKLLFTFLIQNAQNLANEGISNLTISQKNEIINKLRSFASLGIKEEIIKDLIQELVKFYEGKYAFDPECLTG
ncbi:MAG: beta-N-acetylglucosaminidase domain-containing protein [Succinivibrionaceae bacterium]|nr:beta-N-acetylglucosaminidase domain-containing protein [Succinivibrionaceae bacterium]